MFGRDLAAMIQAANQQVAALALLQLPGIPNAAGLADLVPAAAAAHDLAAHHMNQAAALSLIARFGHTK
jgi:hypothetical protein